MPFKNACQISGCSPASGFVGENLFMDEPAGQSSRSMWAFGLLIIRGPSGDGPK
jgi:hypothetical protein